MSLDLKKAGLEQAKLPKHIDIIMDGNGRWAQKRGLPRYLGHQQGMRALGKVVETAFDLQIPCLTVFAFSTENWNRPQDEIDYIMTQIVKQFDRYAKELSKKNIRVKVIGEQAHLSADVKNVIEKVPELTKNNTQMTLVVAFNYGSKLELTNACQKIASLVQAKKIKIEDITPEVIEENLYTFALPPVDLLIRTSGEMRISNFLLWQLAYSELYFTDTYWPDFNQNSLIEALKVYSLRKRRFGKIGEQNE